MLPMINGSSGRKMCIVIIAHRRSNNMRMLSVGTCKTNIKVGPTLTGLWVNLIACMPDGWKLCRARCSGDFSCTRGAP